MKSGPLSYTGGTFAKYKSMAQYANVWWVALVMAGTVFLYN